MYILIRRQTIYAKAFTHVSLFPVVIGFKHAISVFINIIPSTGDDFYRLYRTVQFQCRNGTPLYDICFFGVQLFLTIAYIIKTKIFSKAF